MKTLAAKRLGVHTDTEKSAALTDNEIKSAIRVATEKNYDGIVIQLPLPVQKEDVQSLLDCIPEDKDIDVLTTSGKLHYKDGTSKMIPPVARAIFEILRTHNVNLPGKNIVVLGAGRLVGEPVSLMLERMKIPFSTVDINTAEEERNRLLGVADVIISGIGTPHFVKPNMIKNGVVLIDAGTSEQDGKLLGDIDPMCGEKASLFASVPGGVGPVTVVSLFWNLLEQDKINAHD